MKWISSLCQIFNKTISVEESWVHMTTSLRQGDFTILNKKNLSTKAYASGTIVVSQEATTNNHKPGMHQRQEIFPSVLNRLEGKLKVNRISTKKK